MYRGDCRYRLFIRDWSMSDGTQARPKKVPCCHVCEEASETDELPCTLSLILDAIRLKCTLLLKAIQKMNEGEG